MNELEFRERLTAAAATVPVHPAVPLADIERTARMQRRRRRFRGMAAAGSAAAVLATTVVLASALGGADDVRPAPPIQLDDLGGRCQPMVAVRPPSAETGNGRDSDLVFIESDCSTRGFIAGPTNDYSPALAPDGKSVAFARTLPNEQGVALMLTDSSGSDPRQIASAPDALGDPVFSPDGTRISYWANDGRGHPLVYAISIDGGAPTKLTGNRSVNEIWTDWSPDGTRIVLTRPPNLVVVDVATGEETTTAPGLGLQQAFWGTNNGGALYAVEPIDEGSGPIGYRIVRLDASGQGVADRSQVIDARRLLDATYDDFGIHGTAARIGDSFG